eukprot:scaffold2268_cov349-Prasinococcus_capsulatus_cf.AAC.15
MSRRTCSLPALEVAARVRPRRRRARPRAAPERGACAPLCCLVFWGGGGGGAGVQVVVRTVDTERGKTKRYARRRPAE